MKRLKSSRYDMKNLANIETVVMNEMQADYRMQKNTDFNTSEMDIYPRGASYPVMKKTPTGSTKKKPSKKNSIIVKSPPRGLEFRSVGFSLLYSENSSDPSEQVQIKRINFETPCKIIMAILLIYHVFFECNWSSTEQTPLHDLQSSLTNLSANIWPLCTKSAVQQVPAIVNSTNDCFSQTNTLEEVKNKINNIWKQSLTSVLGRESNTPPVRFDEEKDENISKSVIDKAIWMAKNLRNRYVSH